MLNRILTITTVLLAFTVDSSAQIFDQDPTTGFERVQQALRDKGRAHIIVKLEVPGYQPEGRLKSPADRGLQRSRIASVQSQLLDNVNPVHVRVKRRFRLLPYVALSVTPAGLEAIRHNPLITLITTDAIGQPSGASMPPHTRETSGVSMLEESVPEPASMSQPIEPPLPTTESRVVVGADVANANGCDGDGWSIAILDSGVQNDHPAFAGRVTHEACFSTHDPGTGQESLCPGSAEEVIGTNAANDCTPCRSRSGPDGGPYTYTPSDCDFWPPGQVFCPHGTLITGPAAGDGGGVQGVAPEAEIVAVRVNTRFTDPADCTSPPWDLGCPFMNASDVMAGIEYVAELSETVNIAALNMSLDLQDAPGAPLPQPSECDGIGYLSGIKDAVDVTNSYGIPALAAAGNGSLTNKVSAPACLSNIISVGYTQDGSSHFRGGVLYTTEVDSIGTQTNRDDFLDFWAPGEWITSAWPNDPLETTRTERGTSLATPHVSAAFAALRSKGGTRGIDYYRTLLDSTGVMVYDSQSGVTKPRIDVGAACMAMSVVEVNVKVLLEGPYAGGGMMSPGAILLDSLPTRQPFGDPQFAGTPLEYDSPDAVPGFPADVVDWVELELRTGNSASTAVARRPALLLTDGSVVDYDGVSPVRFLGVDSVGYKVVVRHRNHGDVMSGGKLSTGDGDGHGFWDFTTAQGKAYGTNPMKQIGSEFVMWGGDINIDAQVTVNDFNDWLTQTKVAAEGYQSGDINLDGQVTVSDFNIWLANTKEARTVQVPE